MPTGISTRIIAGCLVLALLTFAACTSTNPPTSVPSGQVSPSMPASSVETPSPSADSYDPAATPSGPFPAQVLGMPVLSVTQAYQERTAGKTDGRAVAVGGYFFQLFPACPWPGPYVAALDDWCRIAAFADSEQLARVCKSSGNGVDCSVKEQTQSFAPLFVPETVGRLVEDFDGAAPIPIVFVGHTEDPRWLQCTPDNEQQCKRAFVIDRVVWANGTDQPATLPQPFNGDSSARVTTQLSMDQLRAAVGTDRTIVSAVASTKAQAFAFDPRWNFVGDDAVWIVRSMGSAGVDASDPTRDLRMTLVDDVTGQVIADAPLPLPTEYSPARLWVKSTRDETQTNSAQNVAAFYRLTDPASGAVLHDGIVSNAVFSIGGGVTNGPGTPLLLDPATYTLSVWLADWDGSTAGAARAQCSTEHEFHVLDDVMIEADFGAAGDCGWSQPALPTFAPF